MFKISFRASLFMVALVLCSSSAAFGQGTAFTYQGKLSDGGNPANGHYDLQFKLFDGAGTQQPPPPQQPVTITLTDNMVTNGIFTVQLDFGECASCFDGSARFLEIAVKPTSGSTFTTLSPRQPVSATPYAIRSANAAKADGLSVACINCITSSQIQSIQGSQVSGNIAGSQINGTIPVASVPDLGASYIKNTTSPQSSSNFNISGNGTADTFNAATQFNIDGNRILSNGGPGNLFAGVGAGGAANTGNQNSFFGANAGNVNMNGSSNAFFGSNAGSRNKGGNNNSFFGRSAGEFNEYQSGNTFIGSLAGFDNGDGDTNMTANFNTFIGHDAGISNSKGASNVFVGKDAGASNVTGNSNTAIGASASFAFTNLVNATAIGSLAQVMQNNSLVLGSINGVNNATADTNVGIGTTAPSQRLHVVGNGLFTGNLTVSGSGGVGSMAINTNLMVGNNASISGNLMIGGTLNATLPATSTFYIQNQTTQAQPSSFNIAGAGKALMFDAMQFNLGGSRIMSNGGVENIFVGGGNAGLSNLGSFNSFFGFSAGPNNLEGSQNSFFGDGAGKSNQREDQNTFIGYQAGFNSGITDTSNAASLNTFVGSQAGWGNTTGNSNTFVGGGAGIGNSGGVRNTTIGIDANVNAGNLSNVTAVGANALVSQSNSLVLGGILGTNGALGDTNVGIGTTAPATRLHVSGTGVIRARINSDSNAGLALTLNNQPKWSVATTTGGNFLIFNDAITQNAFFIDAATSVIGINALGSAGSSHLCINGSNQISGCSSSMRYKTNIATLHSGLNLINRLRPVTFDWKQNGEHDLGLVAEEVAKVEPLLVTHNDKGEIEGVKYDRVGVLLINVVKEQQQQIEALKQIVCLDHPMAEICKDPKGDATASKSKP